MEVEIRKVGILFSGGPAPSANAVISAAALNFLNAGVEVLGFLQGYEFLHQFDPEAPPVEGVHYMRLTRGDVSGIRNRPDILIRTSRADPGRGVRSRADLLDPECSAGLRRVCRALDYHGVDGLVSIGGDGTLKTANYLHTLQELDPSLRRVRVVHLPKTIDNDYYGIDWTFGFTSAAHFAAVVIRNIVADAKSAPRWFVLEIMGRKAGWLTYAAGIAGEATRMISVEEFDGEIDPDAVAGEIADLMETRASEGKNYGVVCVAEGLVDRLPEHLKPAERDRHGNVVFSTAQVGRLLAERAERIYRERTGGKLHVTYRQIGYEVRCASPSAFDVLLGTQLGYGAYRALVEEGQDGVMVSVEGQLNLKYVPFADLVDPETLVTRVRFVPRDGDFFRLVRHLEYQVPESG